MHITLVPITGAASIPWWDVGWVNTSVSGWGLAILKPLIVTLIGLCWKTKRRTEKKRESAAGASTEDRARQRGTTLEGFFF